MHSISILTSNPRGKSALFLLFALLWTVALSSPAAASADKAALPPSGKPSVSKAPVPSRQPPAYLLYTRAIHPNGSTMVFRQALRPGSAAQKHRALQNALFSENRARARAWLSLGWDYGGLLQERDRRLEINGYTELRALSLGTGDMIYELYFPREETLETCLEALSTEGILRFEEGGDMATEWPMAGGGLVQIYRNKNALIAYWGDRFRVTQALEEAHGPPVYVYGSVEHIEMET